MREGSRDVDAYVASASPAAQAHLETLRALVRSEVPGAEERLSYGMPHYHYKGRLIYFAANKGHIGVYGLTGGRDVPAELRDHFFAQGTLRFPFDQPLPLGPLRAALRARADQNERQASTRNRRVSR